jgi:hypothetical protein
MSNLARLLLRAINADAAAPAIPAIGDAYGGGYFAGQFLLGGSTYGLVLSPIAGEGGYLPYSQVESTFPGGASTNDGMLIRTNMIAAGIDNFDSQKFCVGLSIGGFTDWYLPTSDELEMLYRNFKPTTDANNTTTGANTSSIPNTANYTSGVPARSSIAAFQSGGAQAFMSSDYGCATSDSFNYALRSMVSGAVGASGFNGWFPIRAVRRVLMS